MNHRLADRMCPIRDAGALEGHRLRLSVSRDPSETEIAASSVPDHLWTLFMRPFHDLIPGDQAWSLKNQRILIIIYIL